MASPPSNTDAVSHMNGQNVDEERGHTRNPSSGLSDHGGEENEDDDNAGDYSTRMGELFEEGDDEEAREDEEDEEGFIYTGMDADNSAGDYRSQLRDVLGPDLEEEYTEELEVERSLLHEENEKVVFNTDDPQHGDVTSDGTPSTSSMHASLLLTPERMSSPTGIPSKLAKPFLHPTISRLRSYPLQAAQVTSSGSAGTRLSYLFDGVSPSASHLSEISRSSSPFNLNATLNPGSSQNDIIHSDREVFRWTKLRNVGHHIYAKASAKASAVLGSLAFGSPMVMAANGLVCIGTDSGRIFVFDFKQALKCICGNDASAKTVGPVTAVALSHDHTYVASGHASGHVQLFDLQTPQTPARFVAPTSVAAVTSGRQEGHLLGSRIVSVGFVAGRHTALISADERGLAFYHSLGKVLFVDASDILRILGKYAEEDILDSARSSPRPSGSPAQRPLNGSALPPEPLPFRRRRRIRNGILGMAPLPLGTSPHPTDPYNIVALLTPAKLVIVGLKPSAKTWLRRAREGEEDGPRSRSRWKGTLAWWPSVLPSATKSALYQKGATNGKDALVPTTPMLVYSWGSTLYLLRVSEAKVKQTVRNARTGKSSEVDIGTIVFEDVGKWSVDDDVLAVQWLNTNQVVALTSTTLDVYDIRSLKLVERVQFDAKSLISPSLGYTANGVIPYSDSVGQVTHSMRVYKGKIFMLGRDEVRVGTLLTWADRILSFVQRGDFLNAIDLARSYYVGEAPGNRNGLPDDPQRRKEVVGEKMHDLMVASARYTFSEDRMTDGTHFTPDGRGVDRTSLFESLVVTCARACVALGDYEFLFEDLFQQYDDAGISRIFLQQLEAFVLSSDIPSVPPRITQRLVALHEEEGHLDLAERVIWHIDPACLDINQAILLCQTHYLYDALIYVYTRAMRDYVAPVVELVGLIRRVQQYRKSRIAPHDNLDIPDDEALEPIIMNAYKIYPYLADVLAGLTYPSEEPLDDEEGFQAKKDVYTFLFFGHSGVWPVGEGGRLVLTADEEGGVELTYPYARLLLRFDAESFLHALDIAFEDTYLNNESQGVSRLVIVKILLDILSSGGLSPSDTTFVQIFIARNVPKYPQFIQITPSALHGILIGLAEQLDPSTREDRQLAAEYLLSAYTPHDSHHILHLFEESGFYRILRSWHRQEQQWAPLISAYLHDTDLHPTEIFASVDDVLQTAARSNKGTLPADVLATIDNALRRILEISITCTASLVDTHVPEYHEKALDALGPDAAHEQFVYLHHLLGPPQSEDDEYFTAPRESGPSVKVTQHQRHLYISLQCRYHPSAVIEVLKYIPSDLLDWPQVMQICEDKAVYHAVVWAINRRGYPREALSKAETFEKRLTLCIVQGLSGDCNISLNQADTIDRAVSSLQEVGRTGIAICLEHSQGLLQADVPLEDIWFQLLSSQINCVQSLSHTCSEEATSDLASMSEHVALQRRTLSTLRSLVQETFGALVSITSTRAVSFPRLFKRLVDTATDAHRSMGTPYTEFRTILTGMLESYRSDGDMLIITKHLIDRDLFETVEEFARQRARGWTPVYRGTCSYCRQPLLENQKTEPFAQPATEGSDSVNVIVSRTGTIYHSRCLLPES